MKRKYLEMTPPKTMDHKSVQSLVALAGKFSAQIMLEMGSKLINAKSMMGVITLAKSPVAQLNLIVTGEDEEAACDAVAEFIEKL